MAKPLPQITREGLSEIAAAWLDYRDERSRKRLRVLKLVATHKHTAEEVAELCGVSRATVFNYLERYAAGGVAALLARAVHPGRPPKVTAPIRAEMEKHLEQGAWIRAKEAARWLEGQGVKMSLDGVYYWLGKVGGVLKVPRKTHLKKDAAKVADFRATLGEKLLAVSPEATKTRIWVADEHRYGLLPVIRRCWSKVGVRVLAPYKTNYKWGYVYEALELDGKNKFECLFVPAVDLEVSRMFLRQIGESDPESIHVVIWDNAGFHPAADDANLPGNVRLLPLPPYSPELNPTERLGDLVKDRICNKVYGTLETLESAILAELEDFRNFGDRVAQLVKDAWLQLQVNGIAPGLSLIN
jgi:transposase